MVARPALLQKAKAMLNRLPANATRRLSRRQRQARADCRFFVLLAFVSFVLAALSGLASAALYAPANAGNPDAYALLALVGPLAFFATLATLAFTVQAALETRQF